MELNCHYDNNTLLKETSEETLQGCPVPFKVFIQNWYKHYLSGFQPNQQTDTKGFMGLLEGVRTEEMSGSNLHKFSKSSYQKRTKIFSYFLNYYYTK